MYSYISKEQLSAKQRNYMDSIFTEVRASDEMYFATMLSVLSIISHEEHSYSEVVKQQVTYCNWTGHNMHPRTYDSFPIEEVESMRASGAFLMRKCKLREDDIKGSRNWSLGVYGGDGNILLLERIITQVIAEKSERDDSFTGHGSGKRSHDIDRRSRGRDSDLDRDRGRDRDRDRGRGSDRGSDRQDTGKNIRHRRDDDRYDNNEDREKRKRRFGNMSPDNPFRRRHDSSERRPK
jgi:Ni/Co efflux regulator RcnB